MVEAGRGRAVREAGGGSEGNTPPYLAPPPVAAAPRLASSSISSLTADLTILIPKLAGVPLSRAEIPSKIACSRLRTREVGRFLPRRRFIPGERGLGLTFRG